MRRSGSIVLAVAAVFALAACSNSEQAADPNSTTTKAAPKTTGVTTTGTQGPACTADDVTVSGGFGQKPTITIPPGCQPSTQLLVKDLAPGAEPTAKAGDTVEANYLLVTWSDGKVVDNSFDRGETFPVENVGQAQVIKGWNEGLIGIKQGSRRLLIIPADKGYGPQGSPPEIKGGETLVFVIDAVKITSG